MYINYTFLKYFINIPFTGHFYILIIFLFFTLNIPSSNIYLYNYNKIINKININIKMKNNNKIFKIIYHKINHYF